MIGANIMTDKRFDTTPKGKTVKVRTHARVTKHGIVEVREHLRKNNPDRWGSLKYRDLVFLSKPGYAEEHGWSEEEIKRERQQTWDKTVQEKFESHKTYDGPASRPQRMFHKTVQEWIDDQVRIHKQSEEAFARDHPDEFDPPTVESTEQWRYDLHQMMPYSFHARDQVTVDSNLYDVLSYGQSDYGFGSSLYKKLNENLEAAGYGMENYGGGRHDFFKY
jgi:hypothetical protein